VPDLSNLKRDIRLVYTRSKSTNVTTNKSGEMILAVSQSKGKPKFKKQFKGECHLCGAIGHKAAYCWENDKNKAKHPSNYKNKTPDTPSTFQNHQNNKQKC
jgi:hypothetical protein